MKEFTPITVAYGDGIGPEIMQAVLYILILGSDKSEIFLVLSGVGQGSILGVIMFLMFFNDSDVCVPGVHNLNFADDKKLLSIIRSLQDALTLQAAIDMFFRWCCVNGLEINRGKCNVITYTLKRQPIMYDYTLDGEVIKRCTGLVDLGILMNSKMNFNDHFEFISNKSKASLNFVKRQHKFFDVDVLKILYKSLVRSSLEFAACIWSPYQITHKQSLESTQKQFVMFLNGDYQRRVENDYILTPYVDRCIKFGLETLVRRRTNACILFIHSILTGKINSPTLRSLISFNTRPLKNNGLIFLRPGRTRHSTFSPFNFACKMFNVAASNVNPTLPHHQFRAALLQLPDSTFNSFVQI